MCKLFGEMCVTSIQGTIGSTVATVKPIYHWRIYVSVKGSGSGQLGPCVPPVRPARPRGPGHVLPGEIFEI